MNVGGIGAADQAIQAIASGDDRRLQLQVALLRKSLEAQQDQALELLKLAEGKGQVLDIRV